jgi:hypothetical protein
MYTCGNCHVVALTSASAFSGNYGKKVREMAVLNTAYRFQDFSSETRTLIKILDNVGEILSP